MRSGTTLIILKTGLIDILVDGGWALNFLKAKVDEIDGN